MKNWVTWVTLNKKQGSLTCRRDGYLHGVTSIITRHDVYVTRRDGNSCASGKNGPHLKAKPSHLVHCWIYLFVCYCLYLFICILVSGYLSQDLEWKVNKGCTFNVHSHTNKLTLPTPIHNQISHKRTHTHQALTHEWTHDRKLTMSIESNTKSIHKLQAPIKIQTFSRLFLVYTMVQYLKNFTQPFLLSTLTAGKEDDT